MEYWYLELPPLPIISEPSIQVSSHEPEPDSEYCKVGYIESIVSTKSLAIALTSNWMILPRFTFGEETAVGVFGVGGKSCNAETSA